MSKTLPILITALILLTSSAATGQEGPPLPSPSAAVEPASPAAVQEARAEILKLRAIGNLDAAAARLSGEAVNARQAAERLRASADRSLPETSPAWLRGLFNERSADLARRDIEASQALALEADAIAAELAGAGSELARLRQELMELPAADAIRRIGNYSLPNVVRPPVVGLEKNVDLYNVGPTATFTIDYPAVGALLIKQPEGFRLHCSGALVSSRAFLTAAHCFCGMTPGAICHAPTASSAGEIADWRVFFLHEGPIGIETVKLHPDYAFHGDNKGTTADLALLRLAKPVVSIKPLSLDGGSPSNILGTGRSIGFGRYTKPLLGGGLSPPSAWGGTKTYAFVNYDRDCPPGFANAICWGYGSNSPGSPCQGDSGGPLLAGTGAQVPVIGVASAGQPSCQPTSSEESGIPYAWAAALEAYRKAWIEPTLMKLSDADMSPNPAADALDPIVNTGRWLLNSDTTFDDILHNAMMEKRIVVPAGLGRMVVSVAASFSGFDVPIELRDAHGEVRCRYAKPTELYACTIAKPEAGIWSLRVERQAMQDVQLAAVGFAP
jgi:hypothetical protein